MPTYVSPKNIDLVTRRGIFTETEFRARYTIHLEAYNKIIGIEARTMMDMALHQILPASIAYSRSLCDSVAAKKELNLSAKAETALAARLTAAEDALYDHVETLRFSLEAVPKEPAAAADYYHDVVIPAMADLRREADILESLTDKSYWPYPTYSDLLFY